MAPTKGKGNKNEDIKQEDILQAVVIADSFNIRFGPLTRETPRALLPLVNKPLIDYTLEALAASGVQETFVICCHLGEQVREHIRKSKWQAYGSPMAVTAVMTDSCRSLGDALREVDAQSLVRSDFLLVSGDIVANMDFGKVVKEHKARNAGRDKSSVMTLVFRTAEPGHRNRCREDDLFLVEEGESGRLLFFRKCMDSRKIQMPMDVLLEHEDVILHNDLMDAHVSVCSPIVPTLFTDNFDFLTRDDFVKGILINEEIMGNKIHMSVVKDRYAARVSNMQSYDSISKDVVCRWSYPFVPDVYGCDGEKVKYHRHNIYCSKNVTLARGCDLQRDVVVGSGTTIEGGSSISRCIIGKNCHIGENVHLVNSYLWDGVRVESDCSIDTALLASRVTVKKSTTIKPGSILAWDVVVGPSVTIPAGTQLLSAPQGDDWGDFDHSFGDEEDEKMKEEKKVDGEEEASSEEYGVESKAFIFKPRVDSDDEDEAAVPECQWGAGSDVEDELYGSDSDSEAESEGSAEGGSLLDDSEEEEDEEDPTLGFNPRPFLRRNNDFYHELVETLKRAEKEKISKDNVILEINSLKSAYTVMIDEVIGSLPGALYQMGAESLGLAAGAASQPALATFKKNVEKNANMLNNYSKDKESQINMINGIGNYVLRHADVRPRLPQFLNFLYDSDVISEESVYGWFRKQYNGEDETKRHNFLKKLVEPFVRWLQEAEEESSEEDDD